MASDKYFDKVQASNNTNVTELMHIHSFLDECGELIDDEDLRPVSTSLDEEDMDEKMKIKIIKSEIGQIMEVPVTTINELEKVCNPEKLMSVASVDDIANYSLIHSLPNGGERLVCLGLRRKEKLQRTPLQTNYHKTSFDMKHDSKDRQSGSGRSEFLQHPQVLVSVTFMEKTNRHHTKVDREILVLPEQSLQVLLDKLVCVSDLQIPLEFSNNPELPLDTRFDDIFKSSFFFIEGTFYNDMSHALCTDLSQSIIQWARQKKLPGAESYKSVDMESATIGDLKVRLGYPYLYQHQGDCEHLFMFTDIRLLHNQDCQDLNAYPLIVYKHLPFVTNCQICNDRVTRWITKEDEHISTDPGFFCERCFKMLHYDENGQKKGNFLAYPYMDVGIYN